MKTQARKDKNFKNEFLEFFKDKFNLFAFLQLILSIALFITMLVLLVPKISEAISYLQNLKIEQEDEIYGYQLLQESSPIIYLLMFIAHIVYSIYGIVQLIKYQHQRSVFKIMFRSFFYISGILFFRYILGFVFFLLLPITEPFGILVLISLLLTLEVAIGGRLVSNFEIFNTSLKNRKNLGLLTLGFFVLYCIWGLAGVCSEFTIESCVFYVIEFLSGIVGICACIYFQDPTAVSFEQEPKITAKPQQIHDLPINIEVISDHMFAKNTKLNKASIPSYIKRIGTGAFANALRLKEVIIPTSVTEISYNAFFNCKSLTKITYLGNKDEFNKIDKKSNWLSQCKTTLIECKDGILIYTN